MINLIEIQNECQRLWKTARHSTSLSKDLNISYANNELKLDKGAARSVFLKIEDKDLKETIQHFSARCLQPAIYYLRDRV